MALFDLLQAAAPGASNTDTASCSLSSTTQHSLILGWSVATERQSSIPSGWTEIVEPYEESDGAWIAVYMRRGSGSAVTFSTTATGSGRTRCHTAEFEAGENDVVVVHDVVTGGDTTQTATHVLPPIVVDAVRTLVVGGVALTNNGASNNDWTNGYVQLSTYHSGGFSPASHWAYLISETAGAKSSTVTTGNQRTTTSFQAALVQDGGDPEPDPAEGHFDVVDVATVGWSGVRPSVGAIAIADVAEVGWAGGRAAAAAFAVSDGATAGWSGTRPSVGGFVVVDVVTVGWVGHALPVGDAEGGFAVADVSTVGWSGARSSAGAFPADIEADADWSGTRRSAGTFPAADVTTVAWVGQAPLVPGAGGGFDVADVATVGWSGTRDSTGGFVAADQVAVDWTAGRRSAGGYTVPDVVGVSWTAAVEHPYVHELVVDGRWSPSAAIDGTWTPQPLLDGRWTPELEASR